MKNTYYYLGPNPTVDAVLINTLKDPPEILLIKREDATVEGNKWAMPGGFHDSMASRGTHWENNKESVLEALLRELYEETSLDISKQGLRITSAGVYEGNNRDPRDNKQSWSQSHAFLIVLDKEIDLSIIKARTDAKEAKFFPINKLPLNIAFDHLKIIKNALKTLGLSAKTKSRIKAKIAKKKTKTKKTKMKISL